MQNWFNISHSFWNFCCFRFLKGVVHPKWTFAGNVLALDLQRSVCLFIGTDVEKFSMMLLPHQWTFSPEERSLWIMDWHFDQKRWFKVKYLNDGFNSYKHSLSLHKTLDDGLEWRGLLTDHCDGVLFSAVWTLILTAPIHCSDVMLNFRESFQQISIFEWTILLKHYFLV